MHIRNVPLRLKSWSRFRTPYLLVSGDLLGQNHSFTHSGRKVTIALPNQPLGGPNGTSDRLRLRRSRQVGGDGHIVPLEYSIHSVDVSVDVDGEFKLPPEILQRDPKAVDILKDEQIVALNRCNDENHNLALKSFEYWIRMVRWRTELYLIGRDEPDSWETGTATYLIDVQTGKKVWSGTQRITIYHATALSREVWCAVQDRLLQADRIPISVDLYFDSRYHLHIGDLKRAISDAAVAAESHMRAAVQESIPSGTGPELRRLIDEANIRPIIERVYGEALSLTSGVDSGKVPSEIHELFNYRNKILHKGTVEGLTEDKCHKLIAAVRDLLWSKD